MDADYANDIQEEARQRRKEHFLDLTNDALFKYLFANNKHKELTIALLNSLLAPELGHEIKDLEFLPTETISEHKDGRTCRLDVLCVLDSGEQVNIEMQRIDYHNMIKRSLDYWAGCYKGQLAKNEDYDRHVPVICVNILNYEIFGWRKSYFNLATLHLEEPEERLCDDLRLCFIELPKLYQHEKMSKQEQWLMILDPRVSFAEKEKIAMNDAAMSSAIELTKRFSSDYAQRMKYVFEERAERDRVSRDNYFKKEGELKERIKIAVAFMKDGVSLEVISKNVGMSREELLELARENNITVKE